jgi:hypothetical protein
MVDFKTKPYNSLALTKLKNYFKLMVAPIVWMVPNTPAKRAAYSRPNAFWFSPTSASLRNQRAAKIDWR